MASYLNESITYVDSSCLQTVEEVLKTIDDYVIWFYLQSDDSLSGLL